jgi:hypothetical protein
MIYKIYMGEQIWFFAIITVNKQVLVYEYLIVVLCLPALSQVDKIHYLLQQTDKLWRKLYISLTEHNSISILYHLQNEYIYINFNDTDIGISHEELTHTIFSVMFQVLINSILLSWCIL